MPEIARGVGLLVAIGWVERAELRGAPRRRGHSGAAVKSFRASDEIPFSALLQGFTVAVGQKAGKRHGHMDTALQKRV
jgi:hypothetical protein